MKQHEIERRALQMKNKELMQQLQDEITQSINLKEDLMDLQQQHLANSSRGGGSDAYEERKGRENLVTMEQEELEKHFKEQQETLMKEHEMERYDLKIKNEELMQQLQDKAAQFIKLEEDLMDLQRRLAEEEERGKEKLAAMEQEIAEENLRREQERKLEQEE